MQFDRRSLLRGVGATLVGGTALTSLSAAEVQELQDRQASTNGVHLAAEFTEEQQLLGLSETVSVTSARDPTEPGQAKGQSSEDVLHITSLPDTGRERGGGRGGGSDDESDGEHSGDDGVTYDYGFSMVGVSDRDLTVEDLATYGGGTGLAYEWLVTDENVSAVGTEAERAGVGPDEVWLVVREPTAADTGLVDDAVAGRLTALMREVEADRGTGQWHTRDVGVELDEDAEPAWQELSAPSQLFVDIGETPLSAYGDAEVLMVGVGRGDPYDGPSVLDAYYRGLTVAGEEYSFSKASMEGGPGRG
ncbi:hypothetical protein ACAH01_04180 [Halomicrobium sp. HM KBTZ05]|uniref:hypothetical protein n=1 Tax=Halomicrobium sp. HM KBTZ05 TaxID=3242663 RepID=UPI0035560C93